MHSNIVKILDELDKDNLYLLRTYYNVDEKLNYNDMINKIAKLIILHKQIKANMDSEQTDEDRERRAQARARILAASQRPVSKEESEKEYDSECSNPVDIITQEEWSDNYPAEIKIEYLNSDDPINNKPVVYCYNRDGLIEWLSNERNLFARWLSTDYILKMDDEGHRGGPSSKQLYYKLPDGHYIIYKGDLNFDNKYYVAIPIDKVRLGNRGGVIGVSLLHGQTDNTVYLLLDSVGLGQDILEKYKTQLTDFYLYESRIRGIVDAPISNNILVDIQNLFKNNPIVLGEYLLEQGVDNQLRDELIRESFADLGEPNYYQGVDGDSSSDNDNETDGLADLISGRSEIGGIRLPQSRTSEQISMLEESPERIPESRMIRRVPRTQQIPRLQLDEDVDEALERLNDETIEYNILNPPEQEEEEEEEDLSDYFEQVLDNNRLFSPDDFME
jgi:hypothetical protein